MFPYASAFSLLSLSREREREMLPNDRNGIARMRYFLSLLFQNSISDFNHRRNDKAPTDWIELNCIALIQFILI